MFSALQILKAEAAAQALRAVAIVAFELYERLAVGCAFHLQATLLPLADDEVVLGLQLFQQLDGPFLLLVVGRFDAVGKEQRHHRVDDEQVAAGGRQALLAPACL